MKIQVKILTWQNLSKHLRNQAFSIDLHVLSSLELVGCIVSLYLVATTFF